MKKVVRLTESDLVRIVKRVVKEESSPKEKGKDLYTLLHSLRNSINDEDKKEALSKLENVLSIVRDMEDKPKSKRKVNENRHEEKDIFISKGFKGVRMEFGGETASPSDIIELYNAYVEEGIPLVKYLGRDIFMNENDEEIDKYTVLDELDYAILGDEEINYGDEEEEEDDMPSYKTKWRMPSDDDFVNERLNNIVKRFIKEDEDLKVNGTDISKLSDTEVYKLFIDVVKPNPVKVMNLLKKMKSSSKEDSVDINMIETFVESIKNNKPITPKEYMGKRLKTAGKFTQQIINKCEK
jgi:hypothetical protein